MKHFITVVGIFILTPLLLPVQEVNHAAVMAGAIFSATYVLAVMVFKLFSSLKSEGELWKL